MIVNPYEFLPIGAVPLTDTTLFDSDGNVILESIYTGDIPDNYYSNGLNGASIAERVEFGSSCKNIGERAFFAAPLLNGPLIIGHGTTNNIRTIGSRAFYRCLSLEAPVVIGSSVTSIGSYAFGYNVPITELYVDTPSANWTGARAFRLGNPSMVVHVAPQLFNDGTNYDQSWRDAQDLEDEATIVNWDWYPYPVPNDNGPVDSTLYGVGGSVLAELFGPIPNNWNDNETAFGVAVGLDLGSSATSIGDYAFNNNSSLTGDLIISTACTSIGNDAFNNCSGLNGELIIKNNVTVNGARQYNNVLTNIGDRAFYNCTGLNIELLNINVTSIGSYSFSYVPITTLCSTNTLATIGFKSFFSNSSLETAFLASNFSEVNGAAFLNCQNLTKVYIKDVISSGYTIGTNKNVGGSAVEVLNWDWYPYPITNELGPSATVLYGEAANPENPPVIIEDWTGPIPDSFNENKKRKDPVAIKFGVTCTSIGNKAFTGNDNLKGDLRIRYSTKRVGNFALQGCRFDGVLTIENGVEIIDDGAFSGSLTRIKGDIIIPDSVTTIGDYAFLRCGFQDFGFEFFNPINGSIIIGNGVTSIGQYAFKECHGFAGDLVIGNNVNTIQKYTFNLCSELTSITIGNNVEVIDNFAFEGCSGITNGLVIPNSVTSIGQYAFSNCSVLKGSDERTEEQLENPPAGFNRNNFYSINGPLTIGSSVRTIGDYAFNRSGGFTGSLTIPDSVESIGSYAFYDMRILTGPLVIPNSVTSIGLRAFSRVYSISDYILIGDNVEVIDNYAFDGCGQASEYLVGNDSHVSNIFIGCPSSSFSGFSVFGGRDEGLIAIYVNEPDPVAAGFDDEWKGIVDIPLDTTVLTWELYPEPLPNPFNENNTYLFAPDGSFGAILSGPIPEFWNFGNGKGEGFTGLWVGRSASSVGRYAFSGNDELVGSLTIPAECKIIGKRAFGYCGFDGILTIENGVEEIGSSAFAYTPYSGNLVIPDSVTTIGDSAFSAGFGFGDPETVAWDGGTLTIGNSVKTIGSYAFYYCAFVGNLVIPDSVETIGNGAFGQCDAFTGDIIIPNTVTSLGDSAYRDSTGFDGDIVIGKLVTSIGDSAFYRCSGLTGSVTIGRRVENIGNAAFGESTITGFVNIPNSVTRIGYNAFKDCASLDDYIVIGNGVTEINSYAFQNCSNVKYLFIDCEVAAWENEGNIIRSAQLAGMTSLEFILVKTPKIPYDPASAYQGGDAFVYEEFSYRVNDGETLAVGETPTTNPEKVTIIDVSGIPYDPASAYQGGDAFFYEGSAYRVNDGETLAVGETPTTNPEKVTIIKASSPAVVGYEFNPWLLNRGGYSLTAEIVEWENYPAPVINGLPVNIPPNLTPIGDQENIELAAVSLQVAATDPEAGVLTYSAEGLPAGLSIDPVTGLISGTISAGAELLSPYDVTVTVVDDADNPLGVDEDFFFWVVTVNFPPVIETIDDQTNEVTDVISIDGYIRSRQSLQVVATDINNDLDPKRSYGPDILTYSATGLPAGLNIDSATGLIYGIISDGADGSYTVTVTVTDDGNPVESSQEIFNWIVNPLPLDTIFYDPDGNVIPESIYTGDIPDNYYKFGLNGGNKALTIEIGMSCKTIGSRAFYTNPNFSGDLQIPDSVTDIGIQAFHYCDGFAGAKLSLGFNFSTDGARLRTIGSYAFQGVGFVGQLVIPDTVVSIGEDAFQCSFTSIVIGNGLTDEFSIGENTFQNQGAYFDDIYIDCPASSFSANSLRLNFEDIKVYVNDPDPVAAGFDDEWRTFVGLIGKYYQLPIRYEGPAIISTWDTFPNVGVSDGDTVLLDSNGDII